MRQGNLNSRTTPHRGRRRRRCAPPSLTSNSPHAPLRQANNDPSSLIPRWAGPYGDACIFPALRRRLHISPLNIHVSPFSPSHPAKLDLGAIGIGPYQR